MTSNMDQVLGQGIEVYRSGKPVLVFADDGGLLHGEETLKAIIATRLGLSCFTIRGIPRGEFEKTDWPEMLEAARRVFYARLDSRN